jgi:hypothetical protein
MDGRRGSKHHICDATPTPTNKLNGKSLSLPREARVLRGHKNETTYILKFTLIDTHKMLYDIVEILYIKYSNLFPEYS